MKKYGLFLFIPLVLFLDSVLAHASMDSPYSFSLKSFQVMGNVPVNQLDEFDDGNIDPWTVFDPTMVESDGVVTFSNPGTYEENVLDGYFIRSEYSFIGSGWLSAFNVNNGAGDFTGISIWVPEIPGVNQFYGMSSGYEIQVEPHLGLDINLIVCNFDEVTADFFYLPSGLGICFIRAGGNPHEDWIGQGVPIDESDITDDIVLKLIFNDSTDEFSAEFSLDGGTTYQSPFTPMGWGMNTTGAHYDWCSPS